jgi:hypothetical protein
MMLPYVPEERRGQQGDASTPGSYHEGRRQAMAAEPLSTLTADEEEELASLSISEEEHWTDFDLTVRRKLRISADEFVRKVRAGEIVNDDRDAGITYLFMLLDGVSEARLNA